MRISRAESNECGAKVCLLSQAQYLTSQCSIWKQGRESSRWSSKELEGNEKRRENHSSFRKNRGMPFLLPAVPEHPSVQPGTVAHTCSPSTPKSKAGATAFRAAWAALQFTAASPADLDLCCFPASSSTSVLHRPHSGLRHALSGACSHLLNL